MSTSKIFYYPTSRDVAGLQTIDFGEIISDLQIQPYRVTSDAVSIGGRFSRVARRSGMRVRIIHERFTDTALARALYSLQSHLEAGGAISFAVDGSDTYAAFHTSATPFVTGSRPVFSMQPELFTAYGATTPANGDVMHVESFGANPRKEEITAFLFSSDNLTLSSNLKYDHEPPYMIRHRDFFPLLFLSDTSAPILTDDRRISFTLDMTLECYPAHTRALLSASGSDGLPIGGSAGSISKGDLDSVAYGPIGAGVSLSSAADKGTPKSPKISGHIDTVGSMASPLEDAISKIDLLG
tara:strand:+ start:233 stop:1123 length:891 start_codon:yes stop_codon:yes gene_type:complete